MVVPLQYQIFSDIAVKDAEKIISANHLRYEIFDSIFIAERAKGVIIDQHPNQVYLLRKTG